MKNKLFTHYDPKLYLKLIVEREEATLPDPYERKPLEVTGKTAKSPFVYVREEFISLMKP